MSLGEEGQFVLSYVCKFEWAWGRPLRLNSCYYLRSVHIMGGALRKVWRKTAHLLNQEMRVLFGYFS